ncbi:hypothetical protein Pint_36463 [Pistacia integerrima]|uniref:Uncharacterized protein n=1 Tax=Pistacia integerrima TaxID=434235 RepID=A0ACC0Y198_9ROSI|nr:hypothetical protein Pint_36463 [Pistacia integerrima]
MKFSSSCIYYYIIHCSYLRLKVKIEASCYLSKRRPVETGEAAVGGDWRSFNREVQKIHIPWMSKTWSCVCGSEIGDAVTVETADVALESAEEKWRRWSCVGSGDGYGGFARCVALGGVHSVALTSLGKIFAWSHIATSGTHTAAITESVEMKEMEDWALVLVEALMREVDLVSLLSADRGRATLELGSSNYELGRGDKVGGWRPKPIPSLEDVRIIQIASGGCHSLALTDEGKVLSWGYGGHGHLGHSSTENQKAPVVIEALADEHKGKLYMWGNAKDSQLGVPGLPEVMLLQWSTNRKVFSTHIDTTNNPLELIMWKTYQSSTAEQIEWNIFQMSVGGSERKGLAEKWWAVVVAMAEEEQRRPWMDEFVLLAV